MLVASVYVLKEDLKHLWDFVSVGHAKRFWKQWYSRANNPVLGGDMDW